MNAGAEGARLATGEVLVRATNRPTRWLAILASAAAGLGCSADDVGTPRAAEPGQVPRDALPDGLYHDFLDGKFDSAGHPLTAEVWQAEAAQCRADTGFPEAEGLGLWPGWDGAGMACRGVSSTLGRGRFTLNVRALTQEICRDEHCDPHRPVLTLRVADAVGATLAERTLRLGEFLSPLTYQNGSLSFSHAEIGLVSFEIRWAGEVETRLDYVELFRSHRGLLVTPPSGPLEPEAMVRIEVQDPPTAFTLEVRCDDLDRSDALEQLLAAGDATWQDTEFCTIVAAPAAALLEGCALPTRLRVRLMSGSYARATSRITVTGPPAACSFAPDTTRVLLTGFEPFPADSIRDNSSEHAVTGFAADPVEAISVMTMVLPVEFDTAPAMLREAIGRCEPDVVIGFGQGRSEVDLETTAYNLKDSSAIAGGVPDNRGLIGEGSAIVDDGPAELASGLPLALIEQDLTAAGIAVAMSDDPGRYVCNDLFYELMTAARGRPTVAGFVHLPRIPVIQADDQARLQTVVEAAVRRSVDLFRTNP